MLSKICFLKISLAISLFFFRPLYSSCCSGNSGLMGMRLQKYERAAIDLNIGYKNLLGLFYYDKKINFNVAGIDHKSIIEPSFTLGTRVFFNLEPFIKLSLLYKIGQKSIDTGINNIHAGLALNLFEQLKIKLPIFFRLGSSLSIPTGSLSLNYPIFFISLLVEKSFKSILLGFNYALGLPFFTKDLYAPSHTHDLLFLLGFYPYEKGFLNFSLKFMLHGNLISQKYGSILDSNEYKFNFGLSWSHKLHTHAKLQSQIGLDIPVSHLGKNAHNYIYGSLGLRLGIF